MMRFKVLKQMEVETLGGTMTLTPEQVIKLSKEEAIPLLSEGKVKPFCYWLKTIVDECQMPCYEIEARKVLFECFHFKIFWAKRLKELQDKEANDANR